MSTTLHLALVNMIMLLLYITITMERQLWRIHTVYGTIGMTIRGSYCSYLTLAWIRDL